MVQAQLKIFAAVIALIVLAGTVGGAFYAWEKIFKTDMVSRQEINKVLKDQSSKSDPGEPVYQEAMQMIRHNDLDAAREKLKQLIRIYRDSESYADARRVLGEMNMDRIFSRSPMPGKLEFTVKNESGLEAIVNKSRSTIPFVKRINNLGSTVIHPGDRLILFPLDFSIEVRPSQMKVILLHNGEYFKDYVIVDIKLVAGTKLPAATVIASKRAYLGEKAVRDSDAHYSMARKWLQTAGSPSRPGIIFCAPAKKKGDDSPNGIYLSAADLEELCTVVRLKIPVKFIK